MTSCQCYLILFPTINPLFQSPVIQSTISNPLFLSPLWNSHHSPLLLTPMKYSCPLMLKEIPLKLSKSDLKSTLYLQFTIYNRSRLDHSNNNRSWISSWRSLARPAARLTRSH